MPVRPRQQISGSSQDYGVVKPTTLVPASPRDAEPSHAERRTGTSRLVHVVRNEASVALVALVVHRPNVREIARDDAVAVGHRAAERELGPQAEDLLPAAFAPLAREVAARLVEVQCVAAG